MSRVLITFFVGGVTGYASNEALNYYFNKQKNKELPKYDLQKKLAHEWSKSYEPTKWVWNWDGRDDDFRRRQKIEKLKSKNSGEPKGENKQQNHNKEKRDINNNIVSNDSQNRLSKATRHILLIRHGQYNTAGNNDDEHTLTKNGIDQATNTGKHLKQMGLPFVTLLSSTMTRAKETADLIQEQLKGLEIKRSFTDLLREGAPFPPEPPIRHWKPDNRFLEDGSRIEEGFKTFIHRAEPEQTEDSFEIVVCHANVIRYIVCRALQMPPEAWLRMSLQHASITWLTIRPSGRVVLRSFGDGGHIPLPLKTFS